MDGIAIPLAGLALSAVLGLVFLLIPALRPFFLSALITPVFTSIVALLGIFILADMNPARQYGAAYHPAGWEHDPTRLDYLLALMAVLISLTLIPWLAYHLQHLGLTMLGNTLSGSALGAWLIKRRWFGLERSNRDGA